MSDAVKTGKVTGRRELRFASLDEVLADLDRLQAAHNAGALRTIGNWSAGQNFEHLATLLDYSMDGFAFKAPFFVRAFGPLLKKRLLSDEPIPAGLQLKGASAVMVPPDSVTFEQGIDHLRRSIGRIKSGEKMKQRSPVFGALTHDEWITLHLKHCGLHLSFLSPD